MKKSFLMFIMMGMILLFNPMTARAIGGDPKDVSKHYDTIRNLINTQSHSVLTQSQIDEYYEHFMKKSNWRPGEVFPYPNTMTDNAGLINDGKYSYKVNAKGCSAYSKFVRGVIYGKMGSASGYARKDQNGNNTADGLKDLISKKAQFGEQILIRDIHSICFLACDENGFYGLEYWEKHGNCIHLVYYSYQSLAEKSKGRDIWVEDIDTAENNQNKAEISNPRVVNLNSNGFDIAFDLRNNGCTDFKCICELKIHVNKDEVAWARDYLDDIPIRNNQYTISGNTAYAHFTFVDELKLDWFFSDNKWMALISSDKGEVPRTGIDQGPFIMGADLYYKQIGKNDTQIFTLNYENNPIPINISSQLDNTKENEESTEKNNGGNKRPNDTPVGETGNDKDSKGNSTGKGNIFKRVEAPKPREVGYTFTVNCVRYKVVGSGEVYVIGFSSKTKKVNIQNVISVEGIYYNITGISSKAFKGNKNLSEITIGENVKVIGKAAFQGCKNLKTVKIKALNLKQAYKNSFDGTNKNIKVFVRYKDRLKKYKKLIAQTGISKNTKYSYKKF